MTTTLPYGTWPSPLSAADLFAGVASPSNLRVDGEDLWWTETRPGQGGRQALVRHRGGATEDVGPEDWNARTRVHEYGGAPFVVRDGVVLAAHFGDQRWYRLDGDEPQQVTTEGDGAAGLRLADAAFVADTDWFVAVQERHGEGEPENAVVACHAMSGETRVLVGGRDFCSSPRPSRDGRRLAWLAWDHPFMPWDAAELWVADLVDQELVDPRRLAGGEGEAVTALDWTQDGRIAFAWEREDDASLWLVDDLDDEPSFASGPDIGGSVGSTPWRFGTATLAALAGRRVAMIATSGGRDHLVVADLDAGTVEDVAEAPASIEVVQSHGDGVAWIGSESDGVRTVSTWTRSGGRVDVRSYAVDGLRPGDLPTIEMVELPTPDGATTHAVLHLPACEGVVGPDDELPPLLVFTHGGPTGRASPVTTRSIAFWTTRGFAVADVNYRGSTGYGAAYRDALLGRWGELDVIDTIAVASGLAERGVVDGQRMAIRGGSAGGFTTLAVLTTPDHPFACGTSFFGVADLMLLAEHTHKFESRYLDRLVGPLPEASELYRERSPLHHAEQLSKPLLVLQGLEDEVVPPEQSEQMVAAAADNGVPHAYLAFEGEQHGFRRLENLVAWHEAELSFYAQVMGFEPAGDIPVLELS